MTPRPSDHGSPAPSRYNARPEIPLGQVQMNALIDAHLRFQRHMDTMNQMFLASMQAAREEEVKLGKALAECDGRMEAITQCNAWLAARAVSFIADANRMSAIWMDLVVEAMPGLLSVSKQSKAHPGIQDGTDNL